MADPFTLAAVGAGASALGGVVGAAGAMSSGSAQAGMYKYQAGIARVNQQIAKQNADYSRAVGEVEAQQSGMRTRFQIGATKATQAASGFDVNTGSTAAVRESERELGLEDQAVIRSKAAKQAYGYDIEGLKEGAQAGVYDTAAANAKKGGMIGALTSILGGASSVSSKWLQANQYGIGTSTGSGYYGGSPETNQFLRPA